jgi:hypothetical protein
MWLMLPSLLLLVLVAWCLWRIVEKLGLPGFLCVLFFIPLVNVVFLAYLAFADRPANITPTPEPALPELTPPDDTRESSLCVPCGANIPAGATHCPACGWTYRVPVPLPDPPPPAFPLEPPSVEKTYRDYRGF